MSEIFDKLTNSERDSVHSVTINIPQPRVFVQEAVYDIKKKRANKRFCDKVFRKPSDFLLKKYSLPVHANALKKDDLLLSHKLYAKKQECFKHIDRMKIKLQEKFKILNADLRKRLYIEKDTSDDVCAVTDIDDGFFLYLNGHSLNQYIPLYKSLKFQFHKQLRMRQEIGCRQDCVLNIVDNHRNELQAYERSVNRYLKHVKQFDAFISEDYQKSMEILKNSQTLEDKVTEKISLKEHLANRLFNIQSRLIGLDYAYFMQQKYGRFLYYLSPPSWRSKNREFAHSVEIEAKGFDLGTSSEEDTFNVIFEKMQNECICGLVKPVLYFSHPDVLMAMFESIEKQQLNHFSHVTLVAPHAKRLRKMSKMLIYSVEQDSALVAHMIEDLKQLLNFYEQKEVQLQARFMKILYGMFYDTVAATDVLKLQMNLEFCFEKLYAEKPSHLSFLLIAKALEDKYMEYSFQLDSITNNKVKLAMIHCSNVEKEKNKKALKAARELRLFARLEHALLRAFAKNTNEVSLPVRFSSIRKPKRQLTIERASSVRGLTDAEIEYLHLFTDWTENENPANYLQTLTATNRNSSVFS